MSDPGTISDIALAEIVAACGNARTVKLKAGEVLFGEGDDAHSMYLLKRGMLRVLSGGTVLESLRDGGIVGEMAIIEAEMPRSATAIAGSYCELVEIDIPSFLSLVRNKPRFSIALMRIVARRLRIMNRRYRDDART